ncbi:unnamed protein product [Cuscuta europaea]|uniref:Uncharacterized protein n=1 Tax=Cuscuta europaea TaxID=41803 RepID=A0A9P0ZDI3_CUSEU|nr:unnamed protein product [Cuscuta europaea]
MKAENLFEEDPSEANRESWSHKQALLLQKYSLERKLWKQKAHITNSKYYHSFVKIRRRKQQINNIVDSQSKSCSSLPDICKVFNFILISMELVKKSELGICWKIYPIVSLS